MRSHPTAPANVVRISVATSGTDFTAPEADFAALIRAATGFCLDHICHVGTAGVGTALGQLMAQSGGALIFALLRRSASLCVFDRASGTTPAGEPNGGQT